MKIKQKALCFLLTLALVLTSINLWGTVEGDTVHAEDGSDTWVLYELSYYNNDGDTTIISNAKPTELKAGTAINDKQTWITPDGKYKLTMTSNGNTVTLNTFAYQGEYKQVDDLKLPTTLKLVFYTSVAQDKDYEGDTEKYDCVSAKSTMTLMSVGTAFDNKYVTTSTNTYLDLTLPVGVTSIDKGAFAGNTKLRAINFGNAIQTVDESAFSGCNNLSTIDLANLYSHINTIPKNCFYGCNVLQVASIPSTVQNIGEGAFYQCNAIDNLILGDNIKTVGKNAFAMCSNLRYIYITSDYQDWSTIVASNEKAKLIISKINQEPIVASNGNTSSVGSYLFSSQRINTFGKIDLTSISVTCNGVQVPVTEYRDTTYGYPTKAYYFVVTARGTYSVTATDILGNTVTKSFKYEKDINDTVAPTISVSGQGSDGYYNAATVTVNENETYLGSVIIDGNPVTLAVDQTSYSTRITTDGEHTITVSDVFGNSSSKSFKVDSTYPVVKGVESGVVYTKSVKPEFSDNFGIKSATLNGENFTSGSKVEATGVYKLVVSDYAWNTVVVNFTIGLDNPTIQGIQNNAYTNKPVNLKFSCVGGIKSVIDNYNGLSTNLNTSSAKVTKEGEHKITVTGYNGKSSTIKFIIDCAKPKIESSNGKSAYIRNLKSYLTVSDSNLDTVTINGVTVKKEKIKLDKAKRYKVVATDKAGNSTTATYTVDTTAPSIKGVKVNKTYKKAVTVKFYDKYGIKKATVNNKKVSAKQLKKGYKCSKKGNYTVKVWDNAGNSKTVKFKIAKK